MSEPGAKPFIPLNLNKLTKPEVIQRLKPGDPFTFLVTEPLSAESLSDENTVVMLHEGDTFARKYPFDAQPRLFRILETHHDGQGDRFAYLTRFVGFQEPNEDLGTLPPMTNNL